MAKNRYISGEIRRLEEDIRKMDGRLGIEHKTDENEGGGKYLT